MIIKILAAIALVIGGLLIISNGYSIYASRKSGRYVSPVPLIAALFLGVGLFGFEQTRPYAWVGIVIDYGTIILIFAIPKLLWESWMLSSFNLVHRFSSETDERRDDIKLFKRRKFTINTKYDPPVPSDEHGTLAVSKGRTGTWRQEGEVYLLEGYEKDYVLKILKDHDQFKSEEENYPKNREFQYDRLGNLKLKQLA